MTIIPAKKAVESAIFYFADILAPEDIRLEEVELSDDEQYWLVTLSALVPAKQVAAHNALAEVFKKSHERIYKLFKVSAKSSEVKSMKIREVEHIDG